MSVGSGKDHSIKKIRDRISQLPEGDDQLTLLYLNLAQAYNKQTARLLVIAVTILSAVTLITLVGVLIKITATI